MQLSGELYENRLDHSPLFTGAYIYRFRYKWLSPFHPNDADAPLALQFIGVLAASHYVVPVFFLQLVCGLLFLVNRYVPLALTLIGPVIVNILLFHVLMNPSGILPGLIATVCWFVVFYSVRPAFAGIFRQDSE